jgi:hypothetical protein
MDICSANMTPGASVFGKLSKPCLELLEAIPGFIDSGKPLTLALLAYPEPVPSFYEFKRSSGNHRERKLGLPESVHPLYHEQTKQAWI